jgi:hypothetical protein
MMEDLDASEQCSCFALQTVPENGRWWMKASFEDFSRGGARIRSQFRPIGKKLNNQGRCACRRADRFQHSLNNARRTRNARYRALSGLAWTIGQLGLQIAGAMRRPRHETRHQSPLQVVMLVTAFLRSPLLGVFARSDRKIGSFVL